MDNVLLNILDESWYVKSSSYTIDFDIVDQNDELVAVVYNTNFDNMYKLFEIASLISCAPNMYNALINIKDATSLDDAVSIATDIITRIHRNIENNEECVDSL